MRRMGTTAFAVACLMASGSTAHAGQVLTQAIGSISGGYPPSREPSSVTFSWSVGGDLGQGDGLEVFSFTIGPGWHSLSMGLDSGPTFDAAARLLSDATMGGQYTTAVATYPSGEVRLVGGSGGTEPNLRNVTITSISLAVSRAGFGYGGSFGQDVASIEMYGTVEIAYEGIPVPEPGTLGVALACGVPLAFAASFRRRHRDRIRR